MGTGDQATCLPVTAAGKGEVGMAGITDLFGVLYLLDCLVIKNALIFS